MFEPLQLQLSRGSFAGVDAANPDFIRFKAKAAASTDIQAIALEDRDVYIETRFILEQLKREYGKQRSLWKRAATKAEALIEALVSAGAIVE